MRSRIAALIERRDERAGEALYFAVHDHGIHALLAAKVLVHHGLGDLRARGDLLHTRAFEALLGEEPAAHREELLAALGTGHACCTARF